MRLELYLSNVPEIEKKGEESNEDKKDMKDNNNLQVQLNHPTKITFECNYDFCSGFTRYACAPF